MNPRDDKEKCIKLRGKIASLTDIQQEIQIDLGEQMEEEKEEKRQSIEDFIQRLPIQYEGNYEKIEDALIDCVCNFSKGLTFTNKLEFLGDGLANFVLAYHVCLAAGDGTTTFKYNGYKQITDTIDSYLSGTRMTEIGSNQKLNKMIIACRLKTDMVSTSKVKKFTGPTFVKHEKLGDFIESLLGAFYIEQNFSFAKGIIYDWWKIKDEREAEFIGLQSIFQCAWCIPYSLFF